MRPIIACMPRPKARAAPRVLFHANQSGARASKASVAIWKMVHAIGGSAFARRRVTEVW
jgi:hypothetical protein